MKKILLLSITVLLLSNAFSQTNISGIINNYAAVTVMDTVGCNNSFTLTDATAFNVGDSVLIIQMQGALIDGSNNANFGTITSYNSAGNYEKNIIVAKSANVITFGLKLAKTYDITGLVQVVSIPHYTGDVIVNGILTAADWNGATGGILTFSASGNVTMTSTINVNNKGFRGGSNVIAANYSCNFVSNRDAYFYPANSEFGSGKGEGIALFTANRENGRGKQANGGGGGNDHNAGGGGGANGTAGGRGGINDEPGNFNCDGDFPGVGGEGLSYADNRLFLGGGGGAGHGNNAAYIAPDGAGIVLIKANSITGTINADGTTAGNVSNDGGIGASAGGTVFLEVNSWLPGLSVAINGGNGGSTLNINNRCYGPGGGGGVGAFIHNQANFTGTLNASPGNSGLVTNSTNGCNGSTLGATNGVAGNTVSTLRTITISTVPFSSGGTLASGSINNAIRVCENDSLYFDFTVNPTSGQSYEWQIDSNGTWLTLLDNGNYINTNTQNASIRTVNATMQNYQFRLKVFNFCDSVFSLPVSFTIDSLPSLVSPVQNDTLCLNANGFLFINALGADSIHWFSNAGGSFTPVLASAKFNGERTDTLFVDNINTTDTSILYRAALYGQNRSCGAIFSNDASFFLFDTINITQQAIDVNECEGATTSFTINATETTSYQWQVDDGTGFVNIANNATYSGATTDSLVISNVLLAFDGFTYQCIVSNACETKTSAAATLNVVSTQNVNLTIDLCFQDSLVLSNGIVAKTTGIFLDTIITSGCDSIITYDVTVLPLLSDTQQVQICENDSFQLDNGTFVNTAATYIDTFANVSIQGCDSFSYINLSILLSPKDTIVETACSGSTFTSPLGQQLSANGVVIDTFATMLCDSLVSYDVSFSPLVNPNTILDTFCVGANYTLASGRVVNTAGIYQDTISSGVCDSVLTYNLTEAPLLRDTIIETICSGGTFTSPLGQQLSASGTVTDTFATSLCDSLVTYEVSINAITNPGQVVDTFCNNENYILASGRVVNASGVYQDTIANGACDSLIIYTLTELNLITITNESGNATVCLAENHTFSVTATGDNLNYQWQVNGVDLLGETNNTLVLTNVDASLNNTNYQLIIFNDCDTIQSQNMTLTIVSAAEILAQSVDITQCGGFAVELFVNASNVVSYQWQINTGGGFSAVNNGNFNNGVAQLFGTNNDTLAVANYSTAISGNEFRVAINDACGNTILSAPIVITINEAVEITNPFQDTVRCADEERPITVSYVSSSAIWSNGNVGQQFTPTETGNYTVNFTDANNCPNQDEIFVEIIDCTNPCDLFMPTGFSPNSSGVNDILKAITTCELSTFEFSVYNRYGELVFFTNDFTQGWDGTYRGKKAALGSYSWYVNYTFLGENEQQSAKGNVSLLR